MSRWASLVIAFALSACAAPSAPRPALYDFGLSAPPVRVSQPLAGSLAIDDVRAPPWLASEGMIYRLAYENAARPQPYSQSRWAAPPAALFGERLQQRFGHLAAAGVAPAAAGVSADYVLRVELDEFSQVFEAPERSRAHVGVRVSVLDPANAELLAQRDFRAIRPAAPNAAGAARSLREASDAVLDEIAAWLLAHPQVARAGGPSKKVGASLSGGGKKPGGASKPPRDGRRGPR